MSVSTTTTGESVPDMPEASGTGDVVGPASSTDNALARFTGTTGKIIDQATTPVVHADDGSLEFANQVGIVWPTVLSGCFISADSGASSLTVGAHTEAGGNLELFCGSSGQVTIGVSTGSGDISLGDSTLRVMAPQTDKKIDLGTASLRFNDLHVGNTARLHSVAAPGSPAEGQIWFDSTQETFVAFLSGIKNFHAGLLFAQTANVTVSPTAETTLTGAGIGTLALPVNWAATGKSLIIEASGVYTADASPGNLTIKIKKGTTQLLATAVTALTANMTNRLWKLRAEITCRSTTTSIGQGILTLFTAAATMIGWELNGGTGTVAFGSAAETLDVTATLSAASDSITCTNLTVMALG